MEKNEDTLVGQSALDPGAALDPASDSGTPDTEGVILSGAIEMAAGSAFRKSAGIPLPGFGTLSELQRFRGNWTRLGLKKQFQVARYLTTHNWFAATVHLMRVSACDMGFRFKSDEAREYAGQGYGAKRETKAELYPWEEVVSDIFEEVLAMDNAIALWAKDEQFPEIQILDCEDVEYLCMGSTQTITLTFAKIPKREQPTSSAQETLREKLGSPMVDAMLAGRRHTIVKGEDEDWDFEAFSVGKRRPKLRTPAVINIADDLDFIELMKIGDWNGAWARKGSLFHAKKGYKSDSGPAAGTSRYHAKKKQLEAIMASFSDRTGNSVAATNFDVEAEWITFPTEFFGREGTLTREARMRMILWAGWPGILLMEGFAQVRGDRGDVSQMMRLDVGQRREKVGQFIERIFSRDEFRAEGFKGRLEPEWDESLLYNSTELVNRLRLEITEGFISPQGARELAGRDNARETERMRKAHEKKEDFTPVHESKQGLLPQLFPEDYAGGSEGKSASGADDGGEGRPQGS